MLFVYFWLCWVFVAPWIFLYYGELRLTSLSLRWLLLGQSTTLELEGAGSYSIGPSTLPPWAIEHRPSTWGAWP